MAAGLDEARCQVARHDDGSDRIVVITQLDVIPTFVEQAQPVIEKFVVDGRNDPESSCSS
jgi:hypothetical protein